MCVRARGMGGEEIGLNGRGRAGRRCSARLCVPYALYFAVDDSRPDTRDTRLIALDRTTRRDQMNPWRMM